MKMYYLCSDRSSSKFDGLLIYVLLQLIVNMNNVIYHELKNVSVILKLYFYRKYQTCSVTKFCSVHPKDPFIKRHKLVKIHNDKFPKFEVLYRRRCIVDKIQ